MLLNGGEEKCSWPGESDRARSFLDHFRSDEAGDVVRRFTNGGARGFVFPTSHLELHSRSGPDRAETEEADSDGRIDGTGGGNKNKQDSFDATV